MKTSVYETRVQSGAELRHRIFAAAEHILTTSVPVDACRKLHSNWRRTL